MKNRFALFLAFMFVGTLLLHAQNFTKSYQASSCSSSSGVQTVPTGMVMYIDFYDNYIKLMGYEKYVYQQTNNDGSIVYVPVVQGNPTLSTIGVVVSSDCSAARVFQQSVVMGMAMQIVYDYYCIGNGSQPAMSILKALSNYGGGYGGSYGGGNSDIQCSSCGGSGSCKYCYGTGRNEYTRNGRCGVCNGTGRCAGCNGRGRY